jgi:hypothetical protein
MLTGLSKKRAKVSRRLAKEFASYITKFPQVL